MAQLLETALKDYGILSFILALTLSYVPAITTYNIWFHPLAKIPGPFLAKFTNLWLFSTERSGDGANTLAALHKKYGITLIARYNPRF
jgi:hypothetical protein